MANDTRNITIATFAENSLFKAEAYGANLRGPKILDDHGVQVALKSVLPRLNNLIQWFTS